MKGLHPIAALALLIIALLFLYMELQQSINLQNVRHREEGRANHAEDR